MKKFVIPKNPFLLFLPFLIFYSILILILSTNNMGGDESRYLTYAQNIVNGFYSPEAPYIDLGNGPGYPLILTPFVALHLPLIYLKLLNGIFYYLSIILLFKSLQRITSVKLTIIVCLFWSCTPTLCQEMLYILPEVFTAALITLFIFLTLKVFNSDNRKKSKQFIILSGIVFGFIALAKPIFGYVLMFMIVGNVVLWCMSRKNVNYKKGIAILLVALLTTIPYLTYTYYLSGKIFYWSSFGGNNLYWMSSPYEGEYGDWIGYPVSSESEKKMIKGSKELITNRHQKDFDEILKNKEVQEANVIQGVMTDNLIKGIKQDDFFKQIAIQNIKSHPIKFLKNCFSNLGRIIFNFPYSYKIQKPRTLLRLPTNGILFILFIFSLIPTFINWRKILFPIKFMLFIVFLYFAGSILGSADVRMSAIITPILLILIAYIIQKTIKINFTHWEN